jgi:phosphate transport system permease protein
VTTALPIRAADANVPDELRRGALPGRRRVADVAARVAIWLSLLLTVVPLAFVIVFVIAKGAAQWSPEFFDFSGRIPRQGITPGGSMAPAIAGTLLTVGMSSLLAIPLGVLGAIYLNEYGKTSPLARTIRLMADVMTGVPSIVMGLFIFVTIVVLTDSLNAFNASLSLACLMLPVVIRSSEEIFRLVPNELRQGSLALGARRWRMILTVVLPASISGITSGALLAIARAAGETAAIILVIGGTLKVNWSYFEGVGNTALPAQIYRNATEPFQPSVDRAWGAALTLIVIVLITTLIGRLIAARYAIKER